MSAHLSNEYLPLLVDAKDRITSYVNRMQPHVSEETEDIQVLKEELLTVKEQMAHVDKLQNIRIDEMAEEILTLRRENTDLQERSAAAIESVNLSVEDLPPFDESKDNFDAYIWRFEMYAKLRKWPRSVWAMQLGLVLSGKALDTFYGMSYEQQENYDLLKSTIKRKYFLTEETYREKLFKIQDTGEKPFIFMNQLDRLFRSWIEESKTPHTFEGLKNLLLREEFYKRCHGDLKGYLREKSLTEPSLVATAAERYLDAHGGMLSGKTKADNSAGSNNYLYDRKQSKMEKTTRKTRKTENSDQKKCFRCGSTEHKVKDCKKKDQKKCFRCGSYDHLVKDCKKEYGITSKEAADSDQQELCNICKTSGHTKATCWF